MLARGVVDADGGTFVEQKLIDARCHLHGGQACVRVWSGAAAATPAASRPALTPGLSRRRRDHALDLRIVAAQRGRGLLQREPGRFTNQDDRATDAWRDAAKVRVELVR